MQMRVCNANAQIATFKSVNASPGCVGHVSVSCSCLGDVRAVLSLCFAVLGVCWFCGGGSLIFWLCLAYAVVVESRSQFWCVCELSACVYIHLRHIGRWRLSIMSRPM